MKKLTCVLLLLTVCLCLFACEGEKIVWDDIILGEMLPPPPSNEGAVHENSAEDLWVSIDGLSDKQFNDYIKACKKKGFTIDVDASSYSFEAYNADGYKLRLGHYGSDAEMSVELEAPMEMITITWPNSEAGNRLPTPKSAIGKFSYEYSDNFFVYIGGMTKADYAEYVNACAENGFNIDYSKGDDYYYADNSDGWHIDLRYEGNNIMSIDIDSPDKSDDSDTEEIIPDTTEKTPDTTEKVLDGSGVDPDFKVAMDNYEKFMNDYVAFLKKYQSNPSDLGLLADYAKYMSDYADAVKAFEKWEGEDLNDAELAYYVDVQARVSKKLLEVAQ